MQSSTLHFTGAGAGMVVKVLSSRATGYSQLFVAQFHFFKENIAKDVLWKEIMMRHFLKVKNVL